MGTANREEERRLSLRTRETTLFVEGMDRDSEQGG